MIQSCPPTPVLAPNPFRFKLTLQIGRPGFFSGLNRTRERFSSSSQLRGYESITKPKGKLPASPSPGVGIRRGQREGPRAVGRQVLNWPPGDPWGRKQPPMGDAASFPGSTRASHRGGSRPRRPRWKPLLACI